MIVCNILYTEGRKLIDVNLTEMIYIPLYFLLFKYFRLAAVNPFFVILT